MRGCRGEGTVEEDSHISGLESERKLVPFTKIQGTQEEEPLREVKCRFYGRHVKRYLWKHPSRA